MGRYGTSFDFALWRPMTSDETSLGFKAGEVICNLSSARPASRSRMTVQIGVNEHIELSSDLVFTNHSCEPNIAFDLSGQEWKAVALRDVKTGDELTFFYPSTEWNASDPFECMCGSKVRYHLLFSESFDQEVGLADVLEIIHRSEEHSKVDFGETKVH
ncbi:hypothetical protein VNI00_015581 [Paramarasmius palmivorus]|uniref:SET domain-containing protein n=1 Tax=Paramarasmius palmivorus TaxID=297713 RepID=A0AAW0BJ20_9AGAR